MLLFLVYGTLSWQPEKINTVTKRDFPGGAVVKISPSNAEDVGSIHSWRAKLPYTSWSKNPNIKTETAW